MRTRLRTHRGAALLLAVLVLGTSFLAAALPRTLDRDADQALARQLTDATPLTRSLVGSTSFSWTPDTTTKQIADFYSDAHLTRTAETIKSELRSPLHPAPADDSAFGVHSNGVRQLTDPGMPAVDGPPPELTLVYLHGQDQRVHLVAGRLPTGPPPTDASTQSWEIALPQATADLLHVKVGSVLATRSSRVVQGQGLELRAVVVGIYQVNDPKAGFWSATGCLTGPCLDSKPGSPPARYWKVSALIGEAQLPFLSVWAANAQVFWQIAADPHGLPAYRIGEAKAALASALAGPDASSLPARTGYPGLHLTSMLPDLLTRAQEQQSAAAALYAIGPLGAAAVALVVLLLAAGLAADRRWAELSLVRARGGSLRDIAGRLLGESAITVLPASAAGTALALALLPTDRWTTAVRLGGLVGLLSLLAFPALVVGRLRAARIRPVRAGTGGAGAGASRRGPIGRWIGDPRRLVTELAVLTVAGAAVLAVRRRGVAAPGTTLDLLLSAAPLLLAGAGAVLLARGFPLLLAPAARWAFWQPSAIGFLGLARATRVSGSSRSSVGGSGGGSGFGGGSRGGHGAPTVLPLLALLLAVTTAGFGATVLTDTATDRQAAVRQIIGADVQVTTQRPDGLPDGFAAAAAALPGVRSGTSVVVDNSASIDTGDGSRLPGVTLVLVDPQAYSALARRVGVGQIDPALLDDTGSPQDAPVAALASPGLAERLGTAGNTLSLPLPYHDMRLRVAGTVDGTLVLPQGGIGTAVLVVSEQALQRQHPDTAALMAHPTNWFGTGDGIDAGKLRALLAELDGSRPGPVVQPVAGVAQAPDAVPPYTVLTSADYLHRLDDNPLLHSATRLFWAGVLAAGGYTVLSLLLTLLRAAPERAALLARLRTMGLRPRQGWR